ncbi:MAG: hypothetical protein HYZ28_14900 [Myxococcales bacterium]|nr:hypothetical protein [Myxococcales bacterium]
MSNHTRWSLTDAIATANGILSETKRHAARLQDRGVDSSFLQGFADAIQLAQAAAAGQPVRLGAQKGSTAALADTIARAVRQAGAVREAVRRRFPSRKDVQRTFGIGTPKSGASLGQALSSVDAALHGASEHPTETSAAGILARDLTERIDHALAAAELEFAHEPHLLAGFRSVLPSKGKKRPPPGSP